MSTPAVEVAVQRGVVRVNACALTVLDAGFALNTGTRSPLNRSSWCIEIAIGWPTCPLRGANQRSVVSVNACAVSVLDTRPVADL